MGKIDIVTRNYMSDNARFADAFNHLLSDIGEVPANLEEQIQSQKDPDTLKLWHKLAARCDSLEDFMNQM